MVNNIDNSAQVVGDEHKPYIGTGSVLSPFCHDIVEAPLSFDYTFKSVNLYQDETLIFFFSFAVIVACSKFCPNVVK